MLKRIVVLVAVIGSLLVVPVGSAAVQSFTTTLEADILDVDGNCCGTVWRVAGTIEKGQIPGVRPGTFSANLFEGTFDVETPGDPRWIRFTYTALHGNNSFTLSTVPNDDEHSFTWVLVAGTGRYSHWVGSGTYSYELTFSEDPDILGTAILILSGEIGRA